MYLSKLRLMNFRNFSDLKLDLRSGLNFLIGENGQGKTNLLEAMYLLAISKSYRSNAERELVARDRLDGETPPETHNGVEAIVDGEIERRKDRVRAIVGIRLDYREETGGSLVRKQIRVNGARATASGLVGWVKAVLFTADDIGLVHGSPAIRRRFIDILISQQDRDYLRALQRYQKVVSNRNHLLRSMRDHGSSKVEMEFWDNELLKEGKIIIESRLNVISRLVPLAIGAHADLCDGETLSIAYSPSVETNSFEEALSKSKAEDLRAGITMVGPHRDDLEVGLNGMPASQFSSRGQARTIALSMRLAEAAFLKQNSGEEPIVLLDDVLSELDTRRRHQILNVASSYQQAFVTTAEPALIMDSPVRASDQLSVNGGDVAAYGQAAKE